MKFSTFEAVYLIGRPDLPLLVLEEREVVRGLRRVDEYKLVFPDGSISQREAKVLVKEADGSNYPLRHDLSFAGFTSEQRAIAILELGNLPTIQERKTDSTQGKSSKPKNHDKKNSTNFKPKSANQLPVNTECRSKPQDYLVRVVYFADDSDKRFPLPFMGEVVTVSTPMARRRGRLKPLKIWKLNQPPRKIEVMLQSGMIAEFAISRFQKNPGNKSRFKYISASLLTEEQRSRLRVERIKGIGARS